MTDSKTTVGLTLSQADKDLLLRYCSPRSISTFVRQLIHEHHHRALFGEKENNKRLTRVEEKLNCILEQSNHYKRK